MPNPGDYSDEKEWMAVCVPKLVGEGNDQEQAAAICYSMWRDKDQAAKYRLLVGAVKAVGDWEIEIRAVPYGSDSDGQLFDSETDYMEDTFYSPAIIYQHGLKPGAKNEAMRGANLSEIVEDNPVIIGKATSVEKRFDGVYVRAILDKTKEYARRVWEAAKNGIAVASSDSVMHLARLDVGNKRIMYEKTRPGRIAVWPLAGISIWDATEGNFAPASHRAIALPAMKAIYREAGLQFPEIETDTTGGTQADERAQRRTEIIEQSKKILLNEKKRKRS